MRLRIDFVSDVACPWCVVGLRSLMKALDAVGDLYVLGAPLLARFEGLYAGHGLNNQLVRALMANPQAWRVRTFAPELARVG
jgi:UDP-3-O-[3-hydroxymyristoyl] N-acetylglucosamine deacetylase